MTEQEFYHLLQGAVAGSHRHLELLLELYMTLINKYSYIDNVLDEDLRQYIMMHIALNISKFTIE